MKLLPLNMPATHLLEFFLERRAFRVPDTFLGHQAILGRFAFGVCGVDVERQSVYGLLQVVDALTVPFHLQRQRHASRKCIRSSPHSGYFM